MNRTTLNSTLRTGLVRLYVSDNRLFSNLVIWSVTAMLQH